MVDNLDVLRLLHSLIWIFLSHAMCKFVLMQLQHVGISHKVHKNGGWVSQQDNGTYSNFGYRRCPYNKIRLMSHILEDTLTETKKIINLTYSALIN